MSVFVNRSIHLKKIKAIGFDMDYTLVRYHTKEFEKMAHDEAKEKLVKELNYPKDILKVQFDFNAIIQGLVIDKQTGNILKLSRFGKVKTAFHGTKPLPFHEQQQIYSNLIIDLNDDNIQSLDTSFSISNGVLFANLVDLKKEGLKLPSFKKMAADVRHAIDICHSDGTLKGAVSKNIEKFIIKDPEVALLLERLKHAEKKILLVTNSDFNYTNLLMEYTVNPFLKDHKDWKELFDISVTLSCKPKFFLERNNYLTIDTQSGMMTNHFGEVTPGVYQGGNAERLQKDLGLAGEEILYIGDHIYGDVVSLKKTFNWRTALVLDPLEEEYQALIKNAHIQEKIDNLMHEKESLEMRLSTLELNTKNDYKKESPAIYKKIEEINSDISGLIKEYNTYFNSKWGEMMRSGGEESRMADQVEKYACIYMSKVTDLLKYSPKTYFRPIKRMLPHEHKKSLD